MLEVEKLSKHYGKHLALEDVTFTLQKGEIVGFLGVNGAGKSTLMNILAGYLAPSAGSVRLAGEEFLQDPLKSKQQIGFLPESPSLYLEMTTREYLPFIAEIRLAGESKLLQKEAVTSIMQRLQLMGMANRLLGQLSKGYKQRVGIASTLIGDPPLLLWDEPTAGLDPQQLQEIYAILQGLKKEHTILLSSHMLHEIEALCDRVIVIDGGKLLSISTAKELKEQLHRSLLIHVEVQQMLEESDIQQLEADLQGAGSVAMVAGLHGSSRFVVELSGTLKEDGRKLLWRVLKKYDWDLLHFEAKKPSLQESFLQLTAQQHE